MKYNFTASSGSVTFLILGLLLTIVTVLLFSSEVFSEVWRSEYILVAVISRPLAKKNEMVPGSTRRFRHLAIMSDVLPHGIWEMGPDDKGMIVTTNTVKDLLNWQPHIVTQKCIELEGDYIHLKFVEVNKRGLLDAIRWYEESWVGKFKYSFYSNNENYAVETVIYAAGGSPNVGRGGQWNKLKKKGPGNSGKGNSGAESRRKADGEFRGHNT